MWQGKLEAIFIRPEKSQQVVGVNQIRAFPGLGLEGDYFSSNQPDERDSSREVTLIEDETIAALERDYGIILTPGETRRNLITKGVPLNHLVGKRFRIGEVSLKGVRLCEPCSHLEELTQKTLISAMLHRGGLRAQILSPGSLHVGDPIYPVDEVEK